MRIEHSVIIQSDKNPKEALIARHPEGKISGNRKWEADHSVFIESSDFSQGELRLKDFADISISGSVASIESEDRSDDRPIIHWLPEKMCREAILFVPEGEIMREVHGLIENFELGVGEVYQFERMGFARVDYLDQDLVKLIWLHG